MVFDKYGTIGGGGNNKVGIDDGDTTNQAFATIGGGQGNNTSGNEATVGGGAFNIASGQQSTIGGGFDNEAIEGLTTVGGGEGNTAGGFGATVGGGLSNEAGGSRSTVGGGAGNMADGFGATVPGGLQAHASQHGQVAHAAGSFATVGDAQTSVYILRFQTSDAAPEFLFLDGVGQKLILADGQTMAFDILVAARSDAGLSAAYHFRGVIKRTGALAFFVGTPTKQTLAEDVAAWDANVVDVSVPPALAVRVTGTAGTNVRWVATVRTTEVTFPEP